VIIQVWDEMVDGMWGTKDTDHMSLGRYGWHQGFRPLF